jgi:hypothetical protein
MALDWDPEGGALQGTGFGNDEGQAGMGLIHWGAKGTRHDIPLHTVGRDKLWRERVEIGHGKLVVSDDQVL